MVHRRRTGLALAWLGMVGVAGPVHALDPATTAPTPGLFGLIGLARGETARLNVIRLDALPREASAAALSRCSLLLTFVDESGVPFADRQGVPIAAEVSLGPGEAASLELHGAGMGGRGAGLRRSFRPMLTPAAPPADGTPDTCASVEPTLELYETATGRTVALYVPNLRRSQPQLDLAAIDVLLVGQTQNPLVATLTGVVRNVSLVAFAGSQTVRLLMASDSPNNPPVVVASNTLTSLLPGADFQVTGFVAANVAQCGGTFTIELVPGDTNPINDTKIVGFATACSPPIGG